MSTFMENVIKIFILLFSLGLIITTCCSAYFAYRDSKKGIWNCAILMFFLSILNFIFTNIQQTNAANELAKVNKKLAEKSDEIIGYTSGGVNNNPLLIIHIESMPDGNYKSIFSITNQGKYPFPNVIYQIQDNYRIDNEFFAKNHLNGYRDLTTKQINALNKYKAANINYVNVSGKTDELPPNVTLVVYQTTVTKGVSKIVYPFTLVWGNQNYSGLYIFDMDNAGRYRFSAFSITKSDKTPVKNIQDFFPSVPISSWEGAILIPEPKNTLTIQLK